MAALKKIDVHAHFLPPFYREACLETGNGKPDGMPFLPDWSEEAHLDLMRDNLISKSILSISSPGVHLGSGIKTVNLARQCNEFANEIVKRKPEHFGFWASLPLPDIAASLKEITYAVNELNASGFAIETNHRGIYLGDSSLDAVFNELNRVKATVFIHPTTPCFKGSGSPHSHDHEHTAVTFLPEFPNPLMEFMFDTARAVINLFMSGTIARCPNITFVIPHASGALPPIIQRFCTFATKMMHSETDLSLRAVKETLKRQFYFDLAGFPFPDQIHGILRIVGPQRLLYGSDFPFTPPPLVAWLIQEMGPGLEDIFEDESIRKDIYSGNAMRLLGMAQTPKI